MKRFKIYILTTELFIFPSDSQICMIYIRYLLLQLGGPQVISSLPFFVFSLHEAKPFQHERLLFELSEPQISCNS